MTLAAGLAFTFTTAIPVAAAYQWKNDASSAIPADQVNDTVFYLADKMNFDLNSMSSIEAHKAKMELASCELDQIVGKVREYQLTDNMLKDMIKDTAKYYVLENTPMFRAIPDGVSNFVNELEQACVDVHPKPMPIYRQLAEKEVQKKCNWDDVNSREEFDAAARCRIETTRQFFADRGIPYHDNFD